MNTTRLQSKNLISKTLRGIGIFIVGMFLAGQVKAVDISITLDGFSAGTWILDNSTGWENIGVVSDGGATDATVSESGFGVNFITPDGGGGTNTFINFSIAGGDVTFDSISDGDIGQVVTVDNSGARKAITIALAPSGVDISITMDGFSAGTWIFDNSTGVENIGVVPDGGATDATVSESGFGLNFLTPVNGGTNTFINFSIAGGDVIFDSISDGDVGQVVTVDNSGARKAITIELPLASTDVSITLVGFSVGTFVFDYAPAGLILTNLGVLADGVPVTQDIVGTSFGLNLTFAGNVFGGFTADHGAGTIAFGGFSEGGAGLAVTVDNGASPVAITIAVPAIDPVDVSLTLRGFSASTMLAEPSGTPFNFMSFLHDGVPFVATVTHESFSLNYLFGTLNQVPDFTVDDETGAVSFAGFFDGGAGMGTEIDNSGIIADVEIGPCISCPTLADQVLSDLCLGFVASPPASTQGMQAAIDQAIDPGLTDAIICDDGQPGAGSRAACLAHIQSLLP
jgi:hypothetical protein